MVQPVAVVQAVALLEAGEAEAQPEVVAEVLAVVQEVVVRGVVELAVVVAVVREVLVAPVRAVAAHLAVAGLDRNADVSFVQETPRLAHRTAHAQPGSTA